MDVYDIRWAGVVCVRFSHEQIEFFGTFRKAWTRSDDKAIPQTDDGFQHGTKSGTDRGTGWRLRSGHVACGPRFH